MEQGSAENVIERERRDVAGASIGGDNVVIGMFSPDEPHPLARYLSAHEEYEVLPTLTSSDEEEGSDDNAYASPLVEEDQSPQSPPSRRKEKEVSFSQVSFSQVEVREYDVTISHHPCCGYGPPIGLDWTYVIRDALPLDVYESTRRPYRTRRQMLLSYYQRRDTLMLAGHTAEEIKKASKEVAKERFRRGVTLYLLPLYIVEEVIICNADKFYSSLRKNQKEGDNNSWEGSYTEGGPSTAESSSHDDVEAGNSRRSPPRRRVSFSRSPQSRKAVVQNQEESPPRNNSRRDGSGSGSDSRSSGDGHHDPYLASRNSNFHRYGVRVDHSQHDKASEIVLCSLKRPHMRAFHASWFSFFVAFFMWFAITPLLGEVQETLRLSKADVWTSSLCGTAGTIIMRIVMGPACDKFGSRICMAFILVASAIPTALTGLVQTSDELSALRFFIGVAGSSFVACQYWTSSMFTREVAGTANALAAGWGNLGGGVAQVVMGSGLFPLFKWVYGGDGNDDSAEKAWRTVFVVPALLSIVTAILIVAYCDDSPKGDYRERVRRQEIPIVNPCISLSSAFRNWNVWALSLQYACCFGVEVTMTNATALYFKDEFGQTTESAAAIASIFGFMNLFARGLGGSGSDLSNKKHGMKGRLGWQILTLLLQGGGIVIFAFARTLAGAIFALIFSSIMVQSAEGSTFGIVPYVDRRYTGGVVGWVGAGGNVGGVIFAVMFRQFHYTKAFALMGISAAVSALLSFTVRIPAKVDFVDKSAKVS